MNNTPIKAFLAALVLALAGISFAPAAIAQENEPQIAGRYLFVFGTSTEMKKRIPATETEINQLLSLSMNGALHTGDSIGIWTLDKELHVGQFPLFSWRPENAADIAKAINKFVEKQRYTSTNNFKALLPVLERVTQSSPRLTVLIFCDGSDQITGTPYDDGLNSIFKQHFEEQKRERQPFIVVLRTQFGKYAGSSMNFPPGMVNLPVFPPIPKPEPPAPPAPPPVTNVPPPAPVTPLVVIGTHVETNWQAYQRALTNVPEKLAPPVETNSDSPAESNAAPARAEMEKENPPAQVETNLTASPTTNTVPTSDNQSSNRNGGIALAAGFVLGAVALTAIFFFRSRRDHGSLISRSMRK